jgi:N-acyl homoserine lactone hydrolase
MMNRIAGATPRFLVGSQRASFRAISRCLACSALALCSVVAYAAPRLYVFDCGLLSFEDISQFSVRNDETDVRQMFVPCYLIEHEEGRLLWDSGLPLEFAGSGVVDRRPGTWLRYDVSIVDQLAALDLTPQDIDYLALSHFHFDHVGAANAFAESTLLVQQAEYEAAFAPQRGNGVGGYDPALFNALEGSERVLLNGDHDVFSDGTVRIISTPGHTPGHQVLLVHLVETGPVVLSGDLYHLEESRVWRRVPTFNADAEQTLESMDKVERLLEETAASLWIEHNLELANQLRKAPEFYD